VGVVALDTAAAAEMTSRTAGSRDGADTAAEPGTSREVAEKSVEGRCQRDAAHTDQQTTSIHAQSSEGSRPLRYYFRI